MKKELRQKAIKGVTWTVVQAIGTQLSTFAIFLVLARLLDAADFGLVAMGSVSVAFFRLFIGQGLSAALVQRSELEPEHLDTVFWLNAVLGLFVVALVLVLAGWFSELYEQPDIRGIMLWLAVSLFFIALSPVQEAMLRRRLNFRSLALRTLIGEPVGGVVGVTMALLGYGFWSLVAREVVASLVRLLILWFSSDWRPKFRFSTRHLKDLLSFGLNMLGANVLAFANKQLDNFLVGYFMGVSALGYYNVAKRLVNMLNEIISGSINKVAWPVFSTIQFDLARLRRAFFEAIKFTSLVSFPAFLGVVAIAPELVPMLFGEKWGPSIPVMQILAGLGLLRSVMRLHSSLIVGMGRSGWHLLGQTVLSVAYIVGFMIAKNWGLLAVASSYLLVTALFSLFPVWAVRRLVQFDTRAYFDTYSAPVLATLIMLTTSWVLSLALADVVPVWLGTVVLVFVSAAVYIGTIRTLYPVLFGQVSEALTAVTARRKTL